MMTTFGKYLRLCWTFYKSILLLSAVIDAVCIVFIRNEGLAGLPGVLWGKVLSLVVTVFLVDGLKRREYYYYRNLGLGKNLLWGLTLTFDFALFIFLIIISYQPR